MSRDEDGRKTLIKRAIEQRSGRDRTGMDEHATYRSSAALLL
jgi:hypothetical protein